jgi:hypothetical protein
MLAAAFFAILLPGCYHATVTTGLPPSLEKVEKHWAAGWIYGLVPPSTLESAQKCSNGVARVDTQLSFANQLVGFLTWGIYTPMEIVVTCAGARAAGNPELAAGGNPRAALMRAAELSAALHGPVHVRF